LIIMADANLLIKLVENRSDQRIFYQYFEKNEAVLALPTPAIAEFLVRDDNFDRSDYLTKINNFTQVFDFDLKSAHFSAQVYRRLEKSNDYTFKRETKQKVKVDIQIIGMILANQIPKIFTGDTGIAEIVRVLNLSIEVVDVEQENELFDLPLFQDL